MLYCSAQNIWHLYCISFFLAVQQITSVSQWLIQTNIDFHSLKSGCCLADLGWVRQNSIGFHSHSRLFPLVFILGPRLKEQQVPRACSAYGRLLEHKETDQTIKYGVKLLLMSSPLTLPFCQSKSHVQTQQKCDG